MRAALSLLTILPVGRVERTGSAAWFPAAGALVGIAAAGALLLVAPLTSVAHGVAVALVVSAVLSGALHHDGLADTADGLGPRTRDRRLAAMRDSGLGAFGALALLAWLALALTALAPLDEADAAAALIAGHALGRWAALPMMAWVPPARSDGLGPAYAARPAEVAAGLALAAVVAVLVAGPGAGGAAVAAAALAAAVAAALAARTFGGRTGDTAGAAVMVAEVAVYGVLAGF